MTLVLSALAILRYPPLLYLPPVTHQFPAASGSLVDGSKAKPSLYSAVRAPTSGATFGAIAISFNGCLASCAAFRIEYCNLQGSGGRGCGLSLAGDVWYNCA